MPVQTRVAVEESGPDVSRLVESASKGREIVITKAGQPVAKIVPITISHMRPKAGYAKGTVVRMSQDFDDPLPEFEDEP
jgi:prevent-host-death family protein